MKRGIVVAAAALAACAASPEGATANISRAEERLTALEQVSSFGTNPAGLTMYRYVPQGVGPNAPLVLALHGCVQGASDLVNAGWNTLADKHKFYVVYPEQTVANNYMRCFNWAGVYGDPTNLKRGKGENQSIKEMVDKMKADFSIDPKKVFIMGFSAGGAEAALMLATWPDVFAAGATFGGVPYDCGESVAAASSCMKPGKDQGATQWGTLVRSAFPGYAGPWPRLSIWQGTADTIVDPTNTTQLMRQWTDVHGAPQTPSATDTVATYPHAVYKDAQNAVVVETYAITGKDHGTFVDPTNGCGTAAPYVLDAKICGPAYAADFFGITSAPAGDGGTTGGDGGSSGTSGTSGKDGGTSGSSGSSGHGGSSGGNGGSSGASSGGGAHLDGGGAPNGAQPGDTFGPDKHRGSGVAGCGVAPGTTDLRGVAFGAALALMGIRRRASRRDPGNISKQDQGQNKG